MSDNDSRTPDNKGEGPEKTGEELKRKRKEYRTKLIFIAFGLYLIFILGSLVKPFEPGIRMGQNLMLFVKDMLILFPPAFILVGLFTAWIDRGVIEKYFGEASGLKGHLAAVLLSCTTLYPLSSCSRWRPPFIKKVRDSASCSPISVRRLSAGSP
jgi:hypothetical protein